jgi:hypothetical protein
MQKFKSFIVPIKIQTMPCLRQHIAETGFQVLQTMKQLNMVESTGCRVITPPSIYSPLYLVIQNCITKATKPISSLKNIGKL